MGVRRFGSGRSGLRRGWGCEELVAVTIMGWDMAWDVHGVEMFMAWKVPCRGGFYNMDVMGGRCVFKGDEWIMSGNTFVYTSIFRHSSGLEHDITAHF